MAKILPHLRSLWNRGDYLCGMSTITQAQDRGNGEDRQEKGQNFFEQRSNRARRLDSDELGFHDNVNFSAVEPTFLKAQSAAEGGQKRLENFWSMRGEAEENRGQRSEARGQ